MRATNSWPAQGSFWPIFYCAVRATAKFERLMASFYLHLQQFRPVFRTSAKLAALNLVCFRQRTLLAPTAIARRLVNLNLVEPANEHAVSEAIRKDIHALLTDLANLPEKITNESWLKELERKELGTAARERTPAPGELKHAQAQAAHRAARKLETQRARRAGGV